MKKRKTIISGSILLGICALLTQKFCTQKTQNSDFSAPSTSPETLQSVQATDSTPSVATPSTPREQGYRIQEYNGNIAVFEKGQQKPFRKTEIAVKNLPEADRKDLKNGIEVKTNEELQALLEDFSS